MAELSRYDASDKDSGVTDGILANKPGIKNQKDLEDLETLLLKDTSVHFNELLQKGEIQINLSLLFDIHFYFLNTLYTWAGKVRTVDISKGDTFFAPARYINNTLEDFKKILATNILMKEDTKKTVAQKLALIHCEFNAIHPFREGNGRTIRLFLDLIAAQAEYDFIDYSKSTLKEYMQACIDGMKMEYTRMEKVMYKGLKKK